MSTDLNQGGAGTPEGVTPPGQPAAPAAGTVDPRDAELVRLRDEVTQYQGVLQRLEPYAEDIRRYVDDESYRSYVQTGRDLYDNMQQRKPASYSPETQALRDELMGVLKPFQDSFAESRNAQQAAYESKKTQVYNDGKQIVENFVHKHPEIRSNPRVAQMFARNIEELQEEAVQSGRPFKEVWDNFMLAYGGERETAPTPPRQLRANAGEPGIPAAPREGKDYRRADGSLKSTREAFMDVFTRQRRAG